MQELSFLKDSKDENPFIDILKTMEESPELLEKMAEYAFDSMDILKTGSLEKGNLTKNILSVTQSEGMKIPDKQDAETLVDFVCRGKTKMNKEEFVALFISLISTMLETEGGAADGGGDMSRSVVNS